MNPDEFDKISMEEMLGTMQMMMLDLAEECAQVPTEDLFKFAAYNTIALRETDALMSRLMRK